MPTLIIAEKPNVAQRIAYALADKPKVESVNGVRYFYFSADGEEYYVAPAVGHIFTITEKVKSRDYPIFDVEWRPAFEINKESYYTKKYLDVLKALGKKCNKYINACDYDIEGTVIGVNIINFVGNVQNAKRMKFSTLTPNELKESFRNLLPLDIQNYYAGEARHVLDWYWGINLSRALMQSLSKQGKWKVLSIGRIQGPTLAFIAEREMEIESFVPKKYWKIVAEAKGIEFENTRREIFDKNEVEEVLKSVKNEMSVVDVEVKKVYLRPPPPFDLTSLQIEAYHIYKISPSETQAIAQRLYEAALISYPRTSSQKLPKSLGLNRIIEKLKSSEFGEFADELIKKGRFTPAEGKKEDEAHPAIYPTGILPKNLKGNEKKIYDLILRRFLACFYENEAVEEIKVTISDGNEKFVASGVIKRNETWSRVYPFYSIEKNKEIEKFKKGEKLEVKIKTKEGETKPKPRYTKASLIKKLEEYNLGTKATRAEIVETLFKRGYVEGEQIKLTKLGRIVYETLSKYSKEILDPKLTRDIELELEAIQKGKVNEKVVIENGKRILEKILSNFKKEEEKIGKDLLDTINQEEETKRRQSIIGKCKCGGDLIVIQTKKGRFAGCTEYPKCSETYPLPQRGYIIPTNKACELCGAPIIKVMIRKGKIYETCINPKCSKSIFSNANHANATEGTAEKKPKAEGGKKVKGKRNKKQK